MSDQQPSRRNHHPRHKATLPIRSELRRRKLRRNSNSSNNVKDLAMSHNYNHSGEPDKFNASSSRSHGGAASAASSVVPKYMETLYVHRRSSLENRSSTAITTPFTSNSDINAFCFRVNRSPNNSPYTTISKTPKPKKCAEFDPWDIRKGRQEVIRLQPKCGLVIQNIYLLEALPPVRPSLTTLSAESARSFREGGIGQRVKRSPPKSQKPSDADVIFGDSILFKDHEYPRWTLSNIQWLLDLEAPNEEPNEAFHYSEYEDICCLPFATNLLFFKTSY